MLKDFLIAFILSIPGHTDVYKVQAFSPSTDVPGCDIAREGVRTHSFVWAMQVLQRRPDLADTDISPENVLIKCMTVDHIDPDTQPKEEGA